MEKKPLTTLMKENSNGKKNTYDINEREQQWKKKP